MSESSTSSTKNSLLVQVAGNHYKGRAIQPVEFWAANGWDAFAGSILKYITRWRDKGGVVDLEKALHFAHMRMELKAAIPVKRVIPMNQYIKANDIYWLDSAALVALEVWVIMGEEGNYPLDLRYIMFTNNLMNLIEWARANG